MDFSLESIQSAKRERALRLLVLGLTKKGKSTFAGTAPSPIGIPIKNEEGLDALDIQAFPVVNTFSNLMEAIGSLYSGDHKFKSAIIDSFSALEYLVWDETCRIDGAESIEKVGGGYGKGYIEALKQWREIVEGLDALRNDRGMNIILIGHVKVKRFNDPLSEAYDHYSFDIHDKASEFLTRWADGILFFNHKTTVKKEDVGFKKTKSRAIDTGGNKPYMYTQARPSHPGGGRGAWGKLPYELAFEINNGWSVLEAALKAAGK